MGQRTLVKKKSGNGNRGWKQKSRRVGPIKNSLERDQQLPREKRKGKKGKKKSGGKRLQKRTNEDSVLFTVQVRKAQSITCERIIIGQGKEGFTEKPTQ